MGDTFSLPLYPLLIDMYKIILTPTAREECRTVLLAKSLVKVTHLAFLKTKSKVNGENRVASGGILLVNTKKKMSTE